MSKKKTVLIVDDSRALRDALSAAFEEAGYDVGCAEDGEEVFHKLAEYDPDAVLLDIYMPKLNGADVCRLVKVHPHWKKTHLVLMSSRISDEEIEMYRRIGADAVFRKPFDPSVVVAAVAKVIGAPDPAPGE
jgi:DNA-binding response OmpR family regulator